MTQKTGQLTPQQINFSHILLGILLTTLFYTTPLLAGEYHSHEQIRNTAIEFVRSQIPDDVQIKAITAGKIDSRIRFKDCSEALEASSGINKHIAKSWTVGIRCHGDKPWSIYIPVKAKLTRNMLVSKTTITRGETITADKIMFMEQEISHQNKKHFTNADNITGREARKTIRPNRVINSTMLQEALLVRRKETVLIYARSRKIQISMKGTALKNGRYNEMIKVRNNSSDKIIDAVVIDRGIVAINL